MVLRRVWQSVTEPRTLKAVFAAYYLLAFLMGMATLFRPPQSIEGLLGAVTPVWASFILVGGLGALLAVFPGWWWAEKLSIYLIFGGLGAYAFVVGTLHFTSEGSRATQFLVIILAAGPGVIRLVLTRGFGFEPRARG